MSCRRCWSTAPAELRERLAGRKGARLSIATNTRSAVRLSRHTGHLTRGEWSGRAVPVGGAHLEEVGVVGALLLSRHESRRVEYAVVVMMRRATARDLRRSNRSVVLTKIYLDGPVSRYELSGLTS